MIHVYFSANSVARKVLLDSNVDVKIVFRITRIKTRQRENKMVDSLMRKR